MPLSAGAQVHQQQEASMSDTLTLEAVQAEFTLRIDDVLRMCADIQSHLEAQHAALRRIQAHLEAHAPAGR
jgi:hypothetical protein